MGEVQDAKDARKTFVVPAIKSFEHYDFSRAKICCSLTWLVAKAYGTGKGFTIPAHECCINKYQLLLKCKVCEAFKIDITDLKDFISFPFSVTSKQP